MRTSLLDDFDRFLTEIDITFAYPSDCIFHYLFEHFFETLSETL